MTFEMPEPSIENEFQQALQHHQAGQLAAAQPLYERVLVREPGHAVALHLLGVLAAQSRQFDRAAELIGRAIAINPNVPDFHANLGNALREGGQLDKSIDAYRQCLRLKPDSPDTCNYLGGALKSKGLIDDAIAAHRQAIRINPAFPEAHNDLGIALAEKGQFDAAIEAYREAIRIRPAYSQAWNNLGLALAAKEQFDEAITAYQHAISLKPDHEAHNNLANALGRVGRLDEAIEEYRAAIRLKPDSADIFSNLGLVLRIRGLLDEAIVASDEAIRLKPDLAYAHWNVAETLLQQGKYERGWQEYEWRWLWKDFPSPQRCFVQPLWGGEDLTGRTILLHVEQGRGDMFQFMRYVPLVARRAGRVLFDCPEEVFRLLPALANVHRVLPDKPIPPFEVQCTLMSLPLAFKTRVETIPADVPYLRADPGLVQAWGRRLGPSDGRLRVALIWAGNPEQKTDERRSLALSQLTPLASVSGVTFYSLQKGYAAAQASHPPPPMELIDLSGDLHDFTETAAAMMHMDLIISTCTGPAHLAGALGRRVWVMLAFLPDWRWLLDREDSPWYPSMQLFRQKSLGDWTDVIERVAEAMKTLDHK